MFLLAVFLNLGVDPLHQCISLHQHVSKSGTGEDSDHLNETGSEWQLRIWKSRIFVGEYLHDIQKIIYLFSDEIHQSDIIMAPNYLTLSCLNLCWTLININMNVLTPSSMSAFKLNRLHTSIHRQTVFIF